MRIRPALLDAYGSNGRHSTMQLRRTLGCTPSVLMRAMIWLTNSTSLSVCGIAQETRATP